jgi:hypothetical protein
VEQEALQPGLVVAAFLEQAFQAADARAQLVDAEQVAADLVQVHVGIDEHVAVLHHHVDGLAAEGLGAGRKGTCQARSSSVMSRRAMNFSSSRLRALSMAFQSASLRSKVAR